MDSFFSWRGGSTSFIGHQSPWCESVDFFFFFFVDWLGSAFIAHAGHRTSEFSSLHIKLDPFSFVQPWRHYSVAQSACVNWTCPLACIVIKEFALNINSIQKLIRNCIKNLKPQMPQPQVPWSKGHRSRTLHNTREKPSNCQRLVPSEAMS